eukprot:1050626_1
MKQLKQESAKSQSTLTTEANKLREEVARFKQENSTLKQKTDKSQSRLKNEASKLREDVARLKQFQTYTINFITCKTDTKLKDTLRNINKNIHFSDYKDTFSHQRQVIKEWNANTKKKKKTEQHNSEH